MQYPYTLTWAEVAALPNAAEHFDWTDDQADAEFEADLAARIAHYSAYLTPIEGYGLFAKYLHDMGLIVDDAGVTVPSRDVLELARWLMNQIMFEYDDPTHDYVYPAQPPTWELFKLSGDDSVDYFGTQPSCLIGLLLTIADE